MCRGFTLAVSHNFAIEVLFEGQAALMGGCYTGIDEKTGKFIARRRTFDKVREPLYELEKVPACTKDLSGSVIVKPPTRACWVQYLGEMIQLCNEAARRSSKKHPLEQCKEMDGIQSKPLGLEYMADRLDTDDPLWGYVVRSEQGGWMQGFIAATTFTTWHKDFEWNSMAREANISDEEKRYDAQRKLSTRSSVTDLLRLFKWDSSNQLSRELQAQRRAGDPNNEGIIWQRVAEISLLGGLGCGGHLLGLMLEDLEKSQDYDYVVLQATENAIKFYERFGFIRVGAIAKPDQEAMAQKLAEKQRERELKQMEKEKSRLSKEPKTDETNSKESDVISLTRSDDFVWRFGCSKVLQNALEGLNQNYLWNPTPVCPKLFDWITLQQMDVLRQEEFPSIDEFFSHFRTLVSSELEKKSSDACSACYEVVEKLMDCWSDLGSNISSNLFMYVDVDWERKQGFKIYQLVSEGKMYKSKRPVVKAIEWVKVRTPDGSPNANSTEALYLAPKDTKPVDLVWTPRRTLDGKLQSDFMRISDIDHFCESSNCIQISCDTRLRIEKQDRIVGIAYARLHALKVLEQLKNDVQNSISRCVDHVDTKSLTSNDVASTLSEYEKMRRKRIDENQRMMQNSGILELNQEINEDSEKSDSDMPTRKRQKVINFSETSAETNNTSIESESADLSDVETPVKEAQNYKTLMQTTQSAFCHLGQKEKFHDTSITLHPSTDSLEAAQATREGWSAYCHWTYPDQEVDDIHPSYMMARKLIRKKSCDSSNIRSKLRDVPPTIMPTVRLHSKFDTSPQQFFSCANAMTVAEICSSLGIGVAKMIALNQPEFPEISMNSKFEAGAIVKIPSLQNANKVSDWQTICHTIVERLEQSRYSVYFQKPLDWKALGLFDYPYIVSRPMDLETIKTRLANFQYHGLRDFAEDVDTIFDNAITYNPAEDPVCIAALKLSETFNSLWKQFNLHKICCISEFDRSVPKKKKTLFNKVVSVVGRANQYYFVLHFIPDMEWCHLAPLKRCGQFPNSTRSGLPHLHAGRPQWKLAPESEGGEIDVGADRCRIVKAITVNKTADADKEAWDILEVIDQQGQPDMQNKWMKDCKTMLVKLSTRQKKEINLTDDASKYSEEILPIALYIEAINTNKCTNCTMLILKIMKRLHIFSISKQSKMLHSLLKDLNRIVEEACISSPVLRTAYQFANRKLKDEESQASAGQCADGEEQTSEMRDEPDT
eukprot:765843-Hanusia_phi.AAC.1